MTEKKYKEEIKLKELNDNIENLARNTIAERLKIKV